MLKAIIIDDESAALRTLELLLNSYCPDVTVVGKGQSVAEGIELINRHNPDIVFLDIEMPEANGFDLLEKITNLSFEVIFITAYNQFAVKAFKYSAIDYILKPIDIEELVKAVEKVSEIRKTKVSPRERYQALFHNIEQILPRKLVIPLNNDYKYIDLSSVLKLETTKNQYTFTMVDGTTTTCPTSNLDVEKNLTSKGFITLEKGVLINLNKIEKIDKKGNGTIIMEGNNRIPLTPNNREKIISHLEKISNLAKNT
jgi:two-component system LytT family response regulator